MASICDGTKARGSRNCPSPARWLVRLAGDRGAFHAACDLHLAQVGRYLLNGERGGLETHSIHTSEQ